MIQAVLVNRQHLEYGVATVPFPISKEEYENTLVLLEPLEIGDAVKRDCCIDEVSGGFPVLKQLERTNVNLDELDYLAKRLDSFDDYEKTEFQGMASRLDLHGVDEFINLTFCCQEVTVVTDFNNLESLGRRHYLTLGGGASMEEMQGKDFRSVALALLDGEVGRVTPYGVVYDNGFEMSQLYDGRNFPEYCYEDCIMEVEMSSRYASADSPATYLYLPITQIQQARAITRAGGSFYEDIPRAVCQHQIIALRDPLVKLCNLRTAALFVLVWKFRHDQPALQHHSNGVLQPSTLGVFPDFLHCHGKRLQIVSVFHVLCNVVEKQRDLPIRQILLKAEKRVWICLQQPRQDGQQS